MPVIDTMTAFVEDVKVELQRARRELEKEKENDTQEKIQELQREKQELLVSRYLGGLSIYLSINPLIYL